MSDVAFVCPECGHTYEFAAHLAGKRGRCKQCQAIFRIPAPASQPAVPPMSPVALQVPTASASAPSPTSRPPAPSERAHAIDEGKIVFNCPTCGHGYGLDAKMAGKKGRCTTCRGVFTIPMQSLPSRPAARLPTPGPSSRRRVPEADPWGATDPELARARVRADTSRSGTPPASAPSGRPPAAAVSSAEDSGWWELDSSESIPAVTARAGTGRTRAAAAVATPIAASAPAIRGRLGVQVDDDGPIVTARPTRPKWVMYAAIAAGALIGGITYAITYSLVSNAVAPTPQPVADPPKPETKTAATPVTNAEVPEPTMGPAPAPQPGGLEAQHREVVLALIRAYNEIADGYFRIHDADSIPQGRALIDRGVEHLRTAAQRGRSLPGLPPGERQAMIRWGVPPLLVSLDRVLRELGRLKVTPGVRSDFDRVIDAYTRAREEAQRELEHLRSQRARFEPITTTPPGNSHPLDA